MSVSFSITQASAITARPMPSMRPASSSKSRSSLASTLCLVAMTALYGPQTLAAHGNPAICLDALGGEYFQ